MAGSRSLEVTVIPSRELRKGRRRQRWAEVFIGRQAERRFYARAAVLRRAIIEAMPRTNTTYMDAIKRSSCARP